jgi:hypothetical protein
MKNLIPILWMLLLIFLSIILESPIPVKPHDYEGFSALNAKKHMDIMASECHFMGTEENRKVRDYILGEFEKLNIPTEVFTGYCEQAYGSYKQIAKTENIIAIIKGSGTGKSLVLAGHYDSVLSAPGAADDVHAVACMIETARLLKDENLKNDLVFLITDGEEQGLLGAKAFVESKDLSSIGMVLNYEARGNSGAGIFFEWSEGNAWLAKEMRKAASNPVASSMAYEIYNKLPNDTDFTHFKTAGLKGINHAFIDGFSFYHNPADTPERINMRSVQHTGENMWRMAMHFGNADISDIPTDTNASFFNFFGLLVIYPASLDFIILLLLLAVTGLCFYRDLKTGLSIKSILYHLFIIIICSILSVVSCIGLSFLLFDIYPQYAHFYTGQFYNHKWYILAAIGIAIIFLKLLNSDLENLKALQSAGLTLLCLIAVLSYLVLPTASYLIAIPGLGLSLYYYASHYPLKDKLLNKNYLRYLLSTVVLGVWGPVIITLFLAFSIKLLFVPALMAILILLASVILFPETWEGKHYIYLGILFLLSGLGAAHWYSSPTPEKPLPSSLYYQYNVDSKNAYWITNDPDINEGNRSIMAEAEKIELPLPIRKKLAVKTTVQPAVSIPIVASDSSGTRIFIKSEDEVFKSRMLIQNTSNIKSLELNGYPALANNQSENIFYVDLLGFTQDSIEIRFSKKDTLKMDTLWLSSKMGTLPQDVDLPDNYIRKDAYTEIIQSIIF